MAAKIYDYEYRTPPSQSAVPKPADQKTTGKFVPPPPPLFKPRQDLERLPNVIKELNAAEMEVLTKKYAAIFDMYIEGSDKTLTIKAGEFKDKKVGITMDTLKKVVSVADQIRGLPSLQKESAFIKVDREEFIIHWEPEKKESAAAAATPAPTKGLHIVHKIDQPFHKDVRIPTISRVWVVTMGAILPFKSKRSGIQDELAMLNEIHSKGQFKRFQGRPPIPLLRYSNHYAYVMPKEYNSGDLQMWITDPKNDPKKNNPQSIQFRLQLLSQMMEIFKDLCVTLQIRHQDIKPDNIMIDVKTLGKDVDTALHDFEFARPYDPEDIYSYHMTPRDSRQDLLSLRKIHEKKNKTEKDKEDFIHISKQRELFQVALMMYAILFAGAPYNTDNDDLSTGEMWTEDLDQYGYPKEIVELIKSMLHLDHTKRKHWQQAIKEWDTIAASFPK